MTITTGLPIMDDTFKVNEANGVKQYTFVAPQGTNKGEVIKPASNGIYCVGVAMENADNAADVLVRRHGLAPVYAQCAINPGTAVTVSSASAWASVAVTGNIIVGYCDVNSKAAAVGDLILIDLSNAGAIK